MDDFKHFLEANVNQIHSEAHPKACREGVAHSSFFTARQNFPYDPAFKSRFMYIRNMCLNDPVPFDICSDLSKAEQALMLLSFNRVTDALAVLDIPFGCEVIGTTARKRTGAEINTPVLKCVNTAEVACVPYTAEGYSYDNFTVEPLQYSELIYCYIKMADILRNEDNDAMKKFKMKAYLNRVLEPVNELTVHFRRAFYMMQAEMDNSTDGLEKIRNVEIPIDNVLFEYPITFKFDMLITLGIAYKNRYFFKEAYEYLRPYPLYIERIDCLIGLKSSEQAAAEIKAFITLIGDSSEREDRMKLCDLYVKLAHLYQDAGYFDRAFEAFRCTKPLYLKGLYCFRKREFAFAAAAFEAALELTPHDEKIRFSYGCTLIELERFADAIRVLKELRSEDPHNALVSKNLSYCYYKQDDAENTLNALKTVAPSDEAVMQQYFLLSIRCEKLEHIRWALPKITSPDLLRGGVDYLRTNGIMGEAELTDAVRKNPYIDYRHIFSGM